MNSSGAFRIRRVGEWLGTSQGENVQKTGGLAEGRGRLLTTSECVVVVAFTFCFALSIQKVSG
jgi:hypothetical protein